MKMNRDGAKAGRMDVLACTQQIMLKWYHNNLIIIEHIHKVLPSQVECWPLYTIPFRTLRDLWERIQLES